MSAVDATAVAIHPSVGKPKKSKKKKTKGVNNHVIGTLTEPNGAEEALDQEQEDEDGERLKAQAEDSRNSTEHSPAGNQDTEEERLANSPSVNKSRAMEVNGFNHADHDHIETASASAEEPQADSGLLLLDAERRLETAARERDQLRMEVKELRESLEGIQRRHEYESASMRVQLEEATSGKDQAQDQYQKLLGKVNTIRTQLGERLKADAADLQQALKRIEELEQQNGAAKENNESLQLEISRLSVERDEQAQEISELRGRTNMSQQNWAKERDDLLSREAQAREEFEVAKQAMQDWEILVMEERTVREGLADRLAELEEQLIIQREAFNRAAMERDSQSATVDGLQRALREMQEARKQELRELVENSQTQSEDLRKRLKVAEESAAACSTALGTTRQELERVLPFEKEIKEKNLLIGKLRHEAVILNDHLTKALRFLKKGRPEDTVDRQLVTNHFLHFLALDRSDPKKFQVLQLISALLAWNEEQNESAGLVRPGASSGSSSATSLRVPLSAPFRRVVSVASMSQPATFSPDLTSHSPATKDSLAELWSDFLEREAQEGITSSSKASSRRTSQSVGSATPTGPASSKVMSPTAERGMSLAKPLREQRLSEGDGDGS